MDNGLIESRIGNVMKNPIDVMGDKAMKLAGDKAKRGIENFMKAFPDYEIETIVANLEVGGKIPQIKGTLQIEIKKKLKVPSFSFELSFFL